MADGKGLMATVKAAWHRGGRWFRLAIGLGAAALILYLLVRNESITLEKLGMVTGHLGYLIIGLVLIVIANATAVPRWQILLHSQGIKMPFWEAFRLTYIGYFFNPIIPGGTGGDVMKAYYAAKYTDTPEKKAAAVTTVFLDRVIGLYALVAMATAAIIWKSKALWTYKDATNATFRGFDRVELVWLIGAVAIIVWVGAFLLFGFQWQRRWLKPMGAACAALTVATAAAAGALTSHLWPHRGEIVLGPFTQSQMLIIVTLLLFVVGSTIFFLLFSGWMRRSGFIVGVAKKLPFHMTIKRVHEALALYSSRKLAVFYVFALSILLQSVSVMGHWFFGLALGMHPGDVSPENYFFLVPLGLMVNGLPLTPLGMGVGEGAYAYLFRLVGSGLGAMVALLFHVSQFLIGLVGLGFYVAGKSEYRRAMQDAEVEIEAGHAVGHHLPGQK